MRKWHRYFDRFASVWPHEPPVPSLHHVQGAVGDGLDGVVVFVRGAGRHKVLGLPIQLETLVNLHHVIPD